MGRDTKQQLSRERKRRVIADIEANSLYPTQIWCIVCKDIDTNEIFKFRPNTPLGGHVEWMDEFKKFAKEVETWIGHNFLGYDLYHINRLLDMDIPMQDVVDTLVLSRLFRPVSPFKEIAHKMSTDNRIGGHGLEAWGRRLGYPKIFFKDFHEFSEAMLDYCVRDVELNHVVYRALRLEEKGFDTLCIGLEHKVAWLLAEQERNGFFLDQVQAQALLDETTTLLDKMYAELNSAFPPIPRLIRENYRTVYKKDGEIGTVSDRILRQYKYDPNRILEVVEKDVHNLYQLEEFNPKSSMQIAERLVGIGWQPKKLTGTGKPRTDKDTLKDAIDELLGEHPDMPELIHLKTYNIVADRQGKAEKWLSLVEDDDRVHGSISPIGAGTHRCSHFNDNMANVPSVQTAKRKLNGFSEATQQIIRKLKPFEYFDDTSKVFLELEETDDGLVVEFVWLGVKGGFGWEARACWKAQYDDTCIVGADASGIQLRALAHYMNDPSYIKMLLEDDIHVVNGLAAGIVDKIGNVLRSKSKTFIYAWLLGAGDEKIGSLLGVSEDEFEELFQYAERTKIKKPWSKVEDTLLNITSAGVRSKGRKATKKLLATIIKGYRVKEQFLNSIPALKRLKQKDIPKATKEGFLRGLDGRKLWIPSEHLAMSLYLQGFEAVIMKMSMVLYQKNLRAQGIPFKQVAFVHDEFQIETPREYADIVGMAVVKAIQDAGKFFNTNCPLDGEYKIGRHWAQTH